MKIESPIIYLRNRLAERWVEKEADFSVAAAVDPLLTNKAMLYYLLPFPVVSLLQSLLPRNNWILWTVAISVWYVGGFLVFVGLAFRWSARAKALYDEGLRQKESTNRLAVELAKLHREDPDYFTILDWDERIAVEPNGDVELCRTTKLRVGPKPLNVFWTTLDRPNASAKNSKVSISVDQITAGPAIHPLGFDDTWERNGHTLISRVYVHTNRPMQPDEVFDIQVTWRWPEYLRHLVHDLHPEEFKYRLTRRCEHMRIEIILPRQSTQEFPVEVFGSTTSSNSTVHDRVQIVLEASELGPGEMLHAQIQPAITKQMQV